jgi:kumamolisin
VVSGVAVPGTEPMPTDADVIGEVEPSTPLEVTVLVRPRQSLQDLDARLSQAARGEQPVLSREEFAASYGADPADLASVEAFARAHGLHVVESSQARRNIKLRGPAGAFAEAFGVHLRRYRDSSGQTFRAPDSPVYVPIALAGVVQGVFGLDNRRIARSG